MFEDGYYRTKIIITGSVLLIPFLLGCFLPEPLWAMHGPGLFSFPIKLIVFMIAGGLITAPFWWKRTGIDFPAQQLWPKKKFTFIGMAACMAIFYAFFPMTRDLYGDAIYIKEAIDLVIPKWDNRLITEPLEPDFLDTKVGLKSFYQLNNFFIWLLGTSGLEISRAIGYITGGVFAFLWITLVDRHLSTPAWKWIFIAVGLSTPLSAVFMGHYESYALSYTGIMIWMSALGLYFKTASKKWLIALPFVYLLVLQTHITNWLFFPSLLLTIVWHFREKLPAIQPVLTWKGLLIYLGIPAILLGFVAYFFIFANHDGPRQFSKEDFEDTLFLPLYTDEPAPLDRYNLFSLTHIADYINLMFMWSAGALLLLVPPFIFLRKKISWNDPLLLITGSASLLFFAVFFFLNPLLGAVIDWDLFCTPGIVVLPFLLFIYSHAEKHVQARIIAGPVLGLCLLGSSFLFVNASPSLLSKHLEAIGNWNFKTYWIGSSTALIASTELQESETERFEKLNSLARDLEPFATPGNDTEYASLLSEQGLFLQNQRNDIPSALNYFESAYTYSPLLGTNLYRLTVAHFVGGDTTKAFKYGSQLAQLKYQPYKRTLRIMIHISLAAKEYQSAANYAVTYLNRWQDDPTIQEVEQRLRTGDRVHELVFLFSQQ